MQKHALKLDSDVEFGLFEPLFAYIHCFFNFFQLYKIFDRGDSAKMTLTQMGIDALTFFSKIQQNMF